jgi:hypothetical protein
MFLDNPVFNSILTFIVSVGLFYILGRIVNKHITTKFENLLKYSIIALTVIIVIFGTFFYSPNLKSNEILTAIVGAMSGITIAMMTTKKI